MGVKQLALVLDAPGARYRPGDVVSGKVVVSLDADRTVREIYVKLKGTSEVSWSESRSRTDSDGKSETEWVTYSAKETHVESRITLVGGCGQEVQVPAGEHVYHFQASLPPGIPPSFEGVHGHVRYRIKAKVDRSWWMDDAVATFLLVLSDVNLNLQPALREPGRNVREKTLCCCWCRSGPLTLVMDVPSTGFVPGQDVAITVEVDNATASRVQRVICKLVQKVQFKAEGSVNKTETKMASVDFGSVEPRGSYTWTRVLTLPQELPPSGLPNCSIIQLSYCLSVKAKVSGLHVSPTVEIPVVVGTVPLTAMAPFPAVLEPSAPPEPWEAPPPSYEESVYGAGERQTGYPPPSQTKYDRLA